MRSRWEAGEHSCTTCYCDGVTEKAMPARRWLSAFKHVGRTLRQIRGFICQGVMTSPKWTKWLMPCFQEKPLSFR